jgi:nickel-dependent lactate racemase
MGLITLEYAPLWYAGAIVAEKIVIPYVNSLHWIDTRHTANSLNGLNAHAHSHTKVN